MKKTSGRKAKKAVNKGLKQASAVSKKGAKKAKKAAKKLKTKGKSLLKKAKNKINLMKKSSAKSLSKTKDKVYAAEEEIADYVKANPVKSVSAVALTALITGFLTSRFRK